MASSSKREFSKKPALVHTGKHGFRHRFFVMYHATRADNVESILANGFRESTSGMLGPGLYVSRDIENTRSYDGGVCFKLLVYTGKTKMVTRADKRGSWTSEYDSVYLPPNNDVVGSRREETCLKSAKQARILGIAYGFNSAWSGKVRNLEGTNEDLDEKEWGLACGKWHVQGQLCKSIEIAWDRPRGRPDFVGGRPVCIIHTARGNPVFSLCSFSSVKV